MSSFDGPASDVGYRLRQLGASPATWSCVLLILGIQCLVFAVGGENREPARSWFEWFGLSREGVFAGKFWQLLSYGLLHGGWFHVAINAAFLLLIGSRIEHILGRVALVCALLIGVFGGSIGHLLLAKAGVGAASLLVGLSGGCVGLLLLLVTLSPDSRMMPLPISGRSLGIGVLLAELILASCGPSTGILPHLGHGCHFGGGIAGLLFGRWMLRTRVSLASLRQDRERREDGNVRSFK